MRVCDPVILNGLLNRCLGHIWRRQVGEVVALLADFYDALAPKGRLAGNALTRHGANIAPPGSSRAHGARMQDHALNKRTPATDCASARGGAKESPLSDATRGGSGRRYLELCSHRASRGILCCPSAAQVETYFYILDLRDMSGCDMSATLAEGDCHERASGFLSRDHGGLDTCSPIFGLGSSARGVR